MVLLSTVVTLHSVSWEILVALVLSTTLVTLASSWLSSAILVSLWFNCRSLLDSKDFLIDWLFTSGRQTEGFELACRCLLMLSAFCKVNSLSLSNLV